MVVVNMVLFQLYIDMLLPSNLRLADIFHEIVKCFKPFWKWFCTYREMQRETGWTTHIQSSLLHWSGVSNDHQMAQGHLESLRLWTEKYFVGAKRPKKWCTPFSSSCQMSRKRNNYYHFHISHITSESIITQQQLVPLLDVSNNLFWASYCLSHRDSCLNLQIIKTNV